jgi:hypothetical protein
VRRWFSCRATEIPWARRPGSGRGTASRTAWRTECPNSAPRAIWSAMTQSGSSGPRNSHRAHSGRPGRPMLRPRRPERPLLEFPRTMLLRPIMVTGSLVRSSQPNVQNRIVIAERDAAWADRPEFGQHPLVRAKGLGLFVFFGREGEDWLAIGLHCEDREGKRVANFFAFGPRWPLASVRFKRLA